MWSLHWIFYSISFFLEVARASTFVRIDSLHFYFEFIKRKNSTPFWSTHSHAHSRSHFTSLLDFETCFLGLSVYLPKTKEQNGLELILFSFLLFTFLAKNPFFDVDKNDSLHQMCVTLSLYPESMWFRSKRVNAINSRDEGEEKRREDVILERKNKIDKLYCVFFDGQIYAFPCSFCC